MLLPYERRLRAAAVAFPPEVRRYLLRVLVSPSDDRAEAIKMWHRSEETRELAELLIDLEADRLLALDVAEAPQASLGDRLRP